MTATRAEILQAVNAEPNGISSRALAHKLHTPHYNVTSALSKLAAYGHIVKGPPLSGEHRNGYLWCRRPATP